MKLGKLFHLTMLVDDLAGPELFFNSVFSPLCMMRGYSSHWHRHAAIYIIGETSIEPMHVLPPEPGQVGTSWYRFMDRHGPRIHNLAFYVDDLDELGQRLTAAGIRTTDGGGGALFAHPKDTPGMVEFHTPSTPGFASMDPRFSTGWQGFRDDYWPRRHGLGLQRTSHVTILVRDVGQATDFYAGVLDGTCLPAQRSRIDGVDSEFVLLGEDTVVELARPRDDSSSLGRELAAVGEGPIGVTFLVADIDQAAAHLERAEAAPVAEVSDRDIVLDRSQTWGVEWRFTDEILVDDPRA